jgi:asparagine synthase (glutamine-hydrolysing)
MMCAAGKGAVKTFSIGFREQGFNEAEHASAVARHLGTDHTELILSPTDAQALVPQLPTIYDEPFADSSQLPTYLVSKLAREHVTVALSGDGGDEAFGGYVRYRSIGGAWRGMRHLPQAVRRGFRGVAELLSVEAWDGIGHILPRSVRPAHFGDKVLKAAALLDAGDPIEMYRRLITQWPGLDRLQPGIAEHPGWTDQFAGRSNGMTLDARLRLIDMMGYLPDDILTKVDRAAMAVSLEVRVPLIDHRVIEYAWSLPTPYLIHRGQGKRVLRAVLERYVPRDLFERPKMGFSMPVGLWLRGPLRGWAEELLAPDRLAEDGLFNVNLIRQRWLDHRSGKRNWQYALWAVLQFQAWRSAGHMARPSESIERASATA